MDPTALEAFTARVEAELQLRHAAFEQRAVIGFCHDVWPLVPDDGPDPERWAKLFLEAGRAGAALDGGGES
jgi:hypothetical protein